MTTQTYVADLQAQALQAVKTGQAATLEAVQIWRDAAVKMTPDFSSYYDARETVGDPAAILDSYYDFAKKLLELNRVSAHRLLEASQFTTVATAKKATGKTVKAA